MKKCPFPWEISGILSVITENQTAATILLSQSLRMCRSRSKDVVHACFVAAHLGPTKYFTTYAMNVSNFIYLIETACVFKIRCWNTLNGYKGLQERKK